MQDRGLSAIRPASLLWMLRRAGTRFAQTWGGADEPEPETERITPVVGEPDIVRARDRYLHSLLARAHRELSRWMVQDRR